MALNCTPRPECEPVRITLFRVQNHDLYVASLKGKLGIHNDDLGSLRRILELSSRVLYHFRGLGLVVKLCMKGSEVRG